jgi:peptide/nickel transport system permease protein
MAAYLLRRLIYSLISIVGILLVVFVLTRVIGNPGLMSLGVNASQQQIDQFNHANGLDRPLIDQLGTFLSQVLSGNWGNSFQYHEPVLQLIGQHLPNTLELASAAMALAVVLAVPLGVLAAINRNTAVDRLIVLVASIGQSVPQFWLGLVGILIFAVWAKWLPVSGQGGFTNLILPACALAAASLARLTRLQRSSLLEVLRSEYIVTARSKGLPERVVLYRHALRNALIPVVTILGLDVAALLGGAVVIETVFAWPGIGMLVVQALENLDLPLIQGCVLLFALSYVIVNFLVDISYSLIDPRIRYE